MTFRVGQKVVCVDASHGPDPWRCWLGDIPVEGEIYTVTGFSDNGVYGPGLLLEEIKNFPFDGSYAARRFRPVVEKKTDISVFTALLTEETIGASA